MTAASQACHNRRNAEQRPGERRCPTSPRADRSRCRDRCCSRRSPARSAQYPERQITMVVCFPAGGGTDIAARIINTPLGEALGKPVIIENRGGAGGNIAITAVTRMPADGYTLLVCSSAFVVNPSLYAQATYDPLKDFVPLMVIGASPNVFVVPAQSRSRSMKEFIDKAKASRRQDELDQLRRRHHAAARRRADQAPHRHQDAAHPVSPARAPRPPRRWPARSISTPPTSARCRRLIDGGKLRADRRDLEEALAGAAERADAGRGRHQGRRVRHVPGHLRARRHAAADRSTGWRRS